MDRGVRVSGAGTVLCPTLPALSPCAVSGDEPSKSQNEVQ